MVVEEKMKDKELRKIYKNAYIMIQLIFDAQQNYNLCCSKTFYCGAYSGIFSSFCSPIKKCISQYKNVVFYRS